MRWPPATACIASDDPGDSAQACIFGYQSWVRAINTPPRGSGGPLSTEGHNEKLVFPSNDTHGFGPDCQTLMI
jgi:hypothetical protein